MTILEVEGQDFEAKKSQIESLISYIESFLNEYRPVSISQEL